MPEIFVTADLHLSHENRERTKGIRFYCNRPFPTIEEHDDALVSNWNSIVSPKDTVYLVGDFAMKRHAHWIGALKGHKILVRGSHDKMQRDILNQFTEVHDHVLVRDIEKQPVIFSHCAFRVWERSHYKSWNLYGHSHGRLQEWQSPTILAFDVGVDVWDYQPVPWEVIKDKMEWMKAGEGEIRGERMVYREAEENVAYNRNVNLGFLKKKEA